MGNTKTNIVPNGRKIRFLREKAGLNQKGLAHKVDCSTRYIGSLERNEGNHSISFLQSVAEVLGVDISEIVLGELKTIDFDTFIKDRIDGFVGREFFFKKIDGLIADSRTSSGYIIIQGDPGIGKSALMAKLVEQRNCYVHHFNIGLQAINKPQQFLENVCSRLIVGHGLNYDTFPEGRCKDVSWFNVLLKEAAEKTTKDAPLIIVIDALDEVEDARDKSINNILFLPSSLPDNVYIIASARRLNDLRLSVTNLELLDLEAMSPDNINDVKMYIQKRADSEGVKSWMRRGKLNRVDFIDLMADKSEGNFMYLRHVLPEIECGKFAPGEIDKIPHGLRAYYRNHWAQMQYGNKEVFGQIYQPVVCVLAAVHKAVSVEQVADWTTLEPLQVNDVFKEWQEFLHVEIKKDTKNVYRIYHKAFQDFLKEEVDPGLATYHEIIANATLKKVKKRKRKAKK